MAFLCSALLAALLTGPAAAAPEADAERGRLVAFTNPGASPVAEAFERQVLPAARALAEELGIELQVLDARAGAPADVALTPLLVYQNFRGRSLYEGRTTTPQRLRNFLRTARVSTQGDAPLVFEDVPAWRNGRVRVAAPLKITPLTGARPADLAEASFEAEVRATLARGFESFRSSDRVELRRSDRRFYFDVHSYRERDDRLFVTVEVYSQFHCKQPVYSALGEPIEGTWTERGAVYARAGSALEAAALFAMADPAGGDGFDPVPAGVPVVSWESLGLALPPAPERPMPSLSQADLPTRWRLRAARPGDPPRLAFHFLSPLDGLRGEVGELRGELTLGPEHDFEGARGWAEAAVASVSMGEPELDEMLQGERFLDGAGNPVARFELDGLSTAAPRLVLGELVQGQANGSFRMKGLGVDLDVRVQFEIVVDDDGDPLLLAQGAFELPILDPFGMEGPGGPKRANTTLAFEVNFALEAAD